VGSKPDRLEAGRAIPHSFDDVVLPHLDAATRLARWLIRDEHDAEDAVQEASLRAFRHFRTFTGGDGRAWFLRIVRNTCYGRHRPGAQAPFDEEHHSHSSAQPQSDPETILLRVADVASVSRALNRLPERYRRLLVLREIDGLSYRELAAVIDRPIGTVMSRLSRAREALRAELVANVGSFPTSLTPQPAATRESRLQSRG
jgi:RNA polymerase sigma-70 factor, ECF subfamily